MGSKQARSKWKSGLLVVLRFLIGGYLLFEGIFKIIHPGWISGSFLLESSGILSGITHWITSRQNLLNALEFLNTMGLIIIGFLLILGLHIRKTALAGTVLLALFYLFLPPIIGMEIAGPQEGISLIEHKNLIEAFTLSLIAVSPAAKNFGLDILLERRIFI